MNRIKSWKIHIQVYKIKLIKPCGSMKNRIKLNKLWFWKKVKISNKTVNIL